MLLLIVLPIIIILGLLFLFSTIYIVQQQQAYIIERFGRFLKVSYSGLNFKIPVVDRVAAKLSLKIVQLDNHFNTKTKDNVFVTVHVPVQYKVDPNNVQTAFYELNNPEQQIRSYIEDVLRTSICELNLDETYNNKDQIAQQMFDAISAKMTQFGFIIINVLVTSIDPDDKIREAMNSINEAERLKVATEQRMAAERIQIEVAAAAEAEAAKLKGKGIADQRNEIVQGLSKSVQELKDTGLNSQEIMSVLMLNEYMSTLESFAKNQNNNTIFLPGGPAGSDDLRTQIISAMEASKAKAS